MSSRLIAISALLVSCAAFAQLEKPQGIKIGDGRLHPYLDLEGRYDSAVGYFGTAANPTLQGDIGIRIRPGLKFDLLGSNNVVTFNGNGEYVFFTGALSKQSSQASRFQTDIGLDAAFNKQGAIEFQIGDQLVRSDRTSNPVLTVGVLSLYNNLRAAVPIHPGGGALEFTPKVSWAVEFFEPLIASTLPSCPITNSSCQPTRAYEMNYSNLQPGLSARWKFLPKTAVVFDGTFDYRSYFNPGTVGGSKAAALMKLQVGLAGLISSKLSVLVLAGYGHDFITQPTPQTFIAQAELGVLLSDATTFKFGYVRTMQPVPIYGIYGDDRGYLDAKFGIGRFSITGNVAFDYLTFWGVNPANPNTPFRNEGILTAGIAPSVGIFSWFSISAGYNLNYRIPFTTAQAGSNFIRHEAILKLSFTY